MKSKLKQILFVLHVLLFSYFPVIAQDLVIKGRVVDSHSSEVLKDVSVKIVSTDYNTTTDSKGIFNFSRKIKIFGEHILVVDKDGYFLQKIRIDIQKNKNINLDPILLVLDFSELESQIGIINLSDNELDGDFGASVANVSGLLHASKDVFLNAASYDFSSTFFRPRGLDNANGTVLINGMEMNKMFNGRPQWANWGGLNDVQRSREFIMGVKANDYTFGSLAGTTNITMRASEYRKGGRISIASANRSYQWRVMLSYNSGLSVKGWAFSFLASRRFGNEGYINGTLYDANSFFMSAEKKMNKFHSLNFTAFYTPNRRGRSTALTREVEKLKGIRYNPNWGFLNSEIRNSQVRQVKEPIFMLNHYWKINESTYLNNNIGFQKGKIGSTRIDYGGTRLLIIDGQETYLGGARNPAPNYYQRLPSYFLQDENPRPIAYQNAFLAQQELLDDGQLNWKAMYQGNTISSNTGGNSIYVLQEDRMDDTQLTINSIFNTRFSKNILFNSTLSFRTLKSENFAEVKDLLGGQSFLDVDYFAEGDNNIILGNVSQSDLQNRNRMVREGDRYKYNYEINARKLSGFFQAQFKFYALDYYLGATVSITNYQRNGLFENGNFPGNLSLGSSEKVSFTNFGIKGGLIYKVTGRHIIDANLAYFTRAPFIRNTFNNARQNNDLIIGLENEKIQSIDIGYIYRSPIVKSRVTAFYSNFKGGNELGYYFTENISGLGLKQDAFIQEVITGVEKQNIGIELGIEAQLTPTFKLKGAASIGQYTYNNNPNLYITSTDIEGPISFGDGTTKLKNYHIAGGPERAIQIGIEYRDPEFWWTGLTCNFFSNAYVAINKLARSDNFSLDYDGQPFIGYDEEMARELLKQEKFDDYFLINVVGGKSWKVNKYFIGFFASINNALNQKYITGGFEQGRKTNFRDLKEDKSRTYGAIFGPRYFFGNGITYYFNMYIRF